MPDWMISTLTRMVSPNYNGMKEKNPMNTRGFRKTETAMESRIPTQIKIPVERGPATRSFWRAP